MRLLEALKESKYILPLGRRWIIWAQKADYGTQSSRWPLEILASWFLCPCIVLSHTVSGLFCVNHRIWQKWWYFILKLSYERHCGFCLTLFPFSLSLGKTSCHVVRALTSAETHVVRNWDLWPIAGKKLKPLTNRTWMMFERDPSTPEKVSVIVALCDRLWPQ